MANLARARPGGCLSRYCCPQPPKRNQHNFPSKEYFQTRIARPLAERSTPKAQPVVLHRPQTGSNASQASLSRRVLRSMLLAFIFGSLGFAYVEVRKTAGWLRKSKPDSQTEEAHMQEIRQKFQKDPLVQILEADPAWQSAQPAADPETERYPFVQHIDTFMAHAIGGSAGLQMKFYQNPSRAMMCCVVHVGEGVEWGPRTAHTGVLASLVEDSLDWLGSRFTLVSLGKSSESTAIISHKSIQIDFLKDVPTGQVYALWMLPAICLGEDIADVLNVQELRGPKLTTEELKRTVIGMLERRDSLPYEPGKSERYARARVTYDADTTKLDTRAYVLM